MSQDELKCFILFSITGSFMTMYSRHMTKTSSKMFRIIKAQLQKMYKSKPKEYLLMQDRFNKVWKAMETKDKEIEIMNIVTATLSYDDTISRKYGITEKLLKAFSTLVHANVRIEAELLSNEVSKTLIEQLYKEFGLEPKLSFSERLKLKDK